MQGPVGGTEPAGRAGGGWRATGGPNTRCCPVPAAASRPPWRRRAAGGAEGPAAQSGAAGAHPRRPVARGGVVRGRGPGSQLGARLVCHLFHLTPGVRARSAGPAPRRAGSGGGIAPSP